MVKRKFSIKNLIMGGFGNKIIDNSQVNLENKTDVKNVDVDHKTTITDSMVNEKTGNLELNDNEESNIRICPSCNGSNTANSSFCNHCGMKLK